MAIAAAKPASRRNHGAGGGHDFRNRLTLEPMLLKKQLNTLLSILNKHHLPVLEFTLVSEPRFQLKHNSSDFEYSIYANTHVFEDFKGGFFTSFKPDIYHSPTPAYNEPPSSWEGVVKEFEKWAVTLQEELELPDLWAEVAATAQIFAVPAAADEKFTDHELRELQSQLRAAEAKLAASGLPEAAIRELTAAIRETATKAETMSKKDWQIIFVGTIVTAISGLSPEHVQTVYQILKATFSGWLLH